jgi:TP901 family phage tail tape measure protein
LQSSFDIQVGFQTGQAAKSLFRDLEREEKRYQKRTEQREKRQLSRSERRQLKVKKEIEKRRRKLAVDSVQDETKRRVKQINKRYELERKHIKQLLKARRRANEITVQEYRDQLDTLDRRLRSMRDRKVADARGQGVAGQAGVAAAGAAGARGGGLLSRFSGVLDDVGLAGATAASGGIAAAGIAAYKAGQQMLKAGRQAITFEEQLAAVQKTTGLADEELSRLGDELLAISSRTGVAAGQLATMAETAGQAGVEGVDRIAALSETVAKLTSVSDMSAQESSEAIAKISEAFEVPITKAEALGSVINELSNTTASKSGDIVQGLRRVGTAASRLGVTTSEVAAMQATLVESGIKAETAGTTLRNVFGRLETRAKKLAEVTDLTGQEFSELVQEDALEALRTYLAALNEVPSQLAAINVKDVFGDQNRLSVLSMAESIDRLNENMDVSQTAFAESMSLQNEYAASLDSVKKQFNLLTAKVAALGTKLSQTFLPALESTLRGLNALSGSVEETAGEVESLRGEMQTLDETDQLLDRYNQLVEDGKTETDEFRKVVDTLNDKMPGYIAQYDDAGNAVKLYAGQMRKALDAQRKLKRVQLDEQLAEMGAAFTDATEDIAESEDAVDTAESRLNDLTEKIEQARRAAREAEAKGNDTQAEAIRRTIPGLKQRRKEEQAERRERLREEREELEKLQEPLNAAVDSIAELYGLYDRGSDLDALREALGPQMREELDLTSDQFDRLFRRVAARRQEILAARPETPDEKKPGPNGDPNGDPTPDDPDLEAGRKELAKLRGRVRREQSKQEGLPYQKELDALAALGERYPQLAEEIGQVAQQYHALAAAAREKEQAEQKAKADEQVADAEKETAEQERRIEGLREEARVRRELAGIEDPLERRRREAQRTYEQQVEAAREAYEREKRLIEKQVDNERVKAARIEAIKKERDAELLAAEQERVQAMDDIREEATDRQQERLDRLVDHATRLTDALVDNAFAAFEQKQALSDAEVELRRMQFEEEKKALRESLQEQEISRREYDLRMKKLSSDRAEFEKEVERGRASFLKKSAKSVRDVAIGAAKDEAKRIIAEKLAELSIFEASEATKTATQTAGAATRAGAEVSAAATATSAKASETAAHTSAEGTKTASTLSGVAARVAALGSEIGTTLASAGASIISAVAKAIEWLASVVGPFALAAIPAVAAGAYAAFQGAKSLFGFQSGGYTGSGAEDEPAGVVHGGEMVMEAPIVEGQEREWMTMRGMAQQGVPVSHFLEAGGAPGYAGGGVVSLREVGTVVRKPSPRAGGERKREQQAGASAEDVGRLARSVERLAEDVAEAKREPTPAVIGNEAARQAERAAAQERWRENAGAPR